MKKAKEYVGEYEQHRLLDKSKNTVDAYKTDLKQFFDFIGEKDLVDVKNPDIENYKNMLLSTGYKPMTVNRKLVSLRQYIDFINKNEEIDLKIFLEIKQMKIQRQYALEEMLTKAEFDRMVKYAQDEEDLRSVAIFKTMYYTGMRVSEMLTMKIQDIYKEDVTIIGKGRKAREIPMHEKLYEILNNYIRVRKAQPDNPYVFNGHGIGHLQRQRVNEIVKKYAGLAKVKLSKAHPHNFRHLTAIMLLDLGYKLSEIADFLGHSSVDTTRIYTRKTKKEKRQMINML